MRIDRAGWPFITGPLAPAALLAVAGRTSGRGWPRRLAWPFLGLSAYMALFFRAPARRCDTTPPAADEILSPADGVVMVAGEPQPGVAPDGDWQQVSVFLSVSTSTSTAPPTAVRSWRAPTGRAASWPPTARSRRTGTS